MKNNFKEQNPSEYFRQFVQFIFENLDKPLKIPSENYILQTLAQYMNREQNSDEYMNHNQTFEGYLDLLGQEDFHY